jgi:hypothetical protein
VEICIVDVDVVELVKSLELMEVLDLMGVLRLEGALSLVEVLKLVEELSFWEVLREVAFIYECRLVIKPVPVVLVCMVVANPLIQSSQTTM